MEQVLEKPVLRQEAADLTYVVAYQTAHQENGQLLRSACEAARNKSAELLIIRVLPARCLTYGAWDLPLLFDFLKAAHEEHFVLLQEDLHNQLIRCGIRWRAELRVGSSVVAELVRAADESDALGIFVGAGSKLRAQFGLSTARRLRNATARTVICL